MAHYVGLFYGYRESVISGWIGRIALPLWELDGPVPSQMRVYTGNAPDAYGAMITFPWQSEILLLQVWDKTAIFQVSKDGVTYEEEKEVDPDKYFGSWFHRYAAYGFRVKNKTAGQVARYQVIPFR